MSNLQGLLWEKARAAHAKAMEDMIWGASSSGGRASQTSTDEIKWPAPAPRHLYIEQTDLHPAPGETGIYKLADTFFPGARVWLGPPVANLPWETQDAIRVICSDVLPLDATAETRSRLMTTYWPDPPMSITIPSTMDLAGQPERDGVV